MHKNLPVNSELFKSRRIHCRELLLSKAKLLLKTLLFCLHNLKNSQSIGFYVTVKLSDETYQEEKMSARKLQQPVRQVPMPTAVKQLIDALNKKRNEYQNQMRLVKERGLVLEFDALADDLHYHQRFEDNQRLAPIIGPELIQQFHEKIIDIETQIRDLLDYLTSEWSAVDSTVAA